MTIHSSPVSGTARLDHPDFLAGLQFDRGAPASLKQAAKSGSLDTFVSAWLDNLATRSNSNTPSPPSRAFDWTPTQPQLASAWRATSPHPQRRPTIGSDPKRRSPLPAITRLGPDATDGDLLAGLALLCQPPPSKRIHQWLAAWRNVIALTTTRALSPELAYITGLLLTPLKGTATLRRNGQRALQEELIDRTDTDGTPHAEHFDDLPEWLATLVRAGFWGQQFGTCPWNKLAHQRFARLVNWVAPLYRHRNRLALPHRPARSLQELLKSATQLAGPAPVSCVSQSDWAHVAVLRTRPAARAPTVVVTHDRPTPRLDISVDGRTLLEGDWSIQVTGNRHNWTFNHWECVCWQSDEDADYIELQADAGDGRRVDRQILLSRADELLVLADAVVGHPDSTVDAPIACHSSLMLPAPVTAQPATGGRRDWRLAGGGASARVFPLAVPDTPLLATGPSTMASHQNHLSWSHAGPGPGLYMPLVVDFSASRRRRKAEWNPLTVSQDRHVVSPREAGAFRFKLGDVQLVLYRSLTNAHPARAVVGQHVNSETLIGLFGSDGDITPLVTVE